MTSGNGDRRAYQPQEGDPQIGARAADEGSQGPTGCIVESGSSLPHRLIFDDRRGEVFCERCGLVLDRLVLSQERPPPEVRTGSVAENPWSRPRTGGTSARMGTERRDGMGKALPPKIRRHFQRLAKLEWRHRPSRHRERAMARAVPSLVGICKSMQLPDASTAEAISLYRQAVENGLIVGRSSRAFAAASALAVSRSTQEPRTLKEVSRLAGSPPRRVRKALALLSSKFGLRLSLTNPQVFLPRLASAFSLPISVERDAEKVLALAQLRGILLCGSLINIAAAALVLASKGAISEGDTARKLGISRRSVANWRKRLLKEAIAAETPSRGGKK